MPSLLLDKNYRDAADGMMPFVKNATREERGIDIGGETMQEIVIEGDFERFSLRDMDTWGGYLRFVFRDTEAKDDEAIKWRGEMAMYSPELAGLLTAKTQLYIYRRQKVTIRTIRLINGREVSREDAEQEEWPEVTEEFNRIAQYEALR
jgi:hypothetical protein